MQILIDPGMGRRNLVRCLAEAEPEGFVAVPKVQAIRTVLRRRFPRARFNVTVGRRLWWGGVTLQDVRRFATQMDSAAAGPERHPPRRASFGRSLQGTIRLPSTTPEDPAAIIFTSGSTGPPKGVLYRHGNFDRQVTEIRDMYGIEPGEIDLPCFPLFGLFNAAMGVTTVIPRMDFSRPASVDPRNIVEAVEQWQVTQSFGSPAVWKRVGPYCQKRGIRLSSLRRVMSAGAPVPASVLAPMKAAIHPEGAVHVPYGATEALPVATIEANEVLSQTWPLTEQGRGVCVGRRFPGIDWRVIRIIDGPIRSIDDAEELASGEIGELIVRGQVVTTEYVTRRDANPPAKIGSWHRMGDCGYLDEQDRFWFCGRMSQRVVTETGVLYTIATEARFNRLLNLVRSALVGVGQRGRQQPAIVLDFAAGFELDRVAEELRSTMQQTGVRHLMVYPRALPVDVRHNAKIGREQVAVWAEKQLSRRRSPRCVLLRDVS